MYKSCEIITGCENSIVTLEQRSFLYSAIRILARFALSRYSKGLRTLIHYFAVQPGVVRVCHDCVDQFGEVETLLAPNLSTTASNARRRTWT